MVTQRQELPLEGIRVADFCWVTAGPMATAIMAHLGAEVIKIESSKNVDQGRGRPPYAKRLSGINMSAFFNNHSNSKLGVTLNLNMEKGRQIAKKLIVISDIVTDNFSPGTMEKWGLGYEELIKIKPDIIVLHMPALGSKGPYKFYQGYGPGLEALSGLKYIWGDPDTIPVGSCIAYPDMGPNPRHAVVSMLSALHYRNKTGKGQLIELSQLESTICFTGTSILDYTMNARIQARSGCRVPFAVPHGVFRCKGDDRWCVIAVQNDDEWNTLRSLIGDVTGIKDEKFASFLGRKKNEDELNKLIETWTVTKSAEEVMMILQQRGISAAVVQNGEDLLTHDPQLRARNHYLVVNHPEAGELTVDSLVPKLSITPASISRPAPCLGEHNEYVYGKLLGMSTDEINQCYVEGVFD